MAGYTRTNTSDIQSGETVKSAPLNAELNALQTAFAVSGGHKHDGSTEGAFIGLMSDADNDTKIQLEESSDEDIIRFDIAGTEQIVLADGVLKPTTDNDIDLGTSSLEFKNAFFDGTVKTDVLAVDETTTLTGAVTFGNILSIPDGSASAPSITNTGDTNAGLFFSADDTLAFTAGGTAQFTMADGAISPVTDGDIDLGTTDLRFETGFFDNLTVTTTVASAGSLSAGTTIAAGGTITATGTLIASNNATVGGTLVSTGKITADAGIDIDNINIDGTTIALSSGSLTLDAATDIILDAAGNDVLLKADGTTFGSLTNTSGDLIIKSGTTTAATFSGANATLAGTLTVAGATTLAATSFGDANITNVGNIALDSITADGSTITITGNTTFADGSYDFDVASHDGTNGLKLGGSIVTSSAAELNYLDISTLGTSQASKAVTVDSNGDLVIPDSDKFKFGTGSDMQLYHDGSNSYITNATGALKVATETSGIAVTIGHSTSEVTVADNLTVAGNLTVSGTQTVVDTVTMNAQNAIVFEGATADAHQTTLSIVDPTADHTYYLPDLGSTNDTGYIVAFEADPGTSALITSTPAELNILDGATIDVDELNILKGTTTASDITVADADRVVLNDNGTMKQVAMTNLAAYLDDEITAMPNLVTTAATTVGALNSGTITSGFGTIDIGSSAFTTTGTINFGNLADGSITIAGFKDEDDMASNSATHVPTQQSVLAYITATMGSVSSAASSATAAAASYDSFDDRYLGTKSSAPSVDNDGDALVTGALYFNSSTNTMNVRTSAGGWTNAGSSVNGTSVRESFIVGTNSTNSAGVSYSGSLTSFPIAYDANYVDVYHNGVKLVNGTDVTVSSGSAVVLAANATAGDTLDAVGYGTFENADHYTKTASDGRYAALSGATFTGNVSAGSNNLTATGTVSLGPTSFNDQNITNVGNIALDSLTADGSTITITGNTTFADGSFDFNVASHDGTNGLALGGTVVTASAEELNHVDGVTSAIQTQIDTKSPLASPTFTGDVTLTGATSGRNVIFDASDDALEFADNAKAVFGTGADMDIYHDATNSYITNKTGALKIATETSGIAVTIGHTTSEVTVADNLTITGDLTVNGATTTVATTNTTVADHLIKLGQSYTGSANDQGFIVTRGDGSSSNTANRGFIWDESADEFATVAANTEAGTTTGNVTINDYANLHVGAITADDSITVGGILKTDDTTDATSTTDGSLQTDGGLSVAKDAVLGNDLKLLSDAAFITFGTSSGVSLQHHPSALRLNSSNQLQFGDGGTYIHQSADGVLDLVSDSELELNATTIDINGAVDMSSTLGVTGKITADAGIDIDNITVDGNTISSTDSNGDINLTPNGTGKVNITSESTTNTLQLTSTNSSTPTAPDLIFYRNSDTPANGDFLARIDAVGRNDNQQDVEYFSIQTSAQDVVDGSEDCSAEFYTMTAGTKRNRFTIYPSSSVFNQDSVDVDFRVESDGNTHALFVDGGNNRVGILNSSPSVALDVTGAIVASDNVTAFSDERLKDNVVTIPEALSKVEAMRGVHYTKDSKAGSGVIAQELEKVAPELVENATEYKSVAYGNITGYLIEAVKELSAKVKELEARLD